MTRTLFALLYTTLLILCPALSHALDSVEDTLELATSLCLHPDDIPDRLANHSITEEELIVRGSRLGTETVFTSDTDTFKLDHIEPAGRPKRTALSVSEGNNINKPGIWMILDTNCKLQQAKRAVFDDNNTPLYIETLDQTLTALPQRDWLNPPLPERGKTDGLRVAMIDSGVNYTLDEIAESLALNAEGDLIGYDYWDEDKTPFDANPAQSWFFVQRHGTRTASILLNEAPDIALVPYRYPRPDMSRMAQLIEHAKAHSIRIIGMPLGSNNHTEWAAFSKAVDTHPDILFIVSAGNNGRDIDLNPVYPAAFDHPNIVVVTSADDFIRPAERTNYGRLSVDYLLPAERITALDYSGEQTLVSGSSYAVSRLTALAARILTKQPELTVDQLKDSIRSYAVRADTTTYVSIGYIGDPVADTANISSMNDPQFTQVSPSEDTALRVALNLVALTDEWSTNKITDSLHQVNDIYAQCGISIDAKALIRVQAPDYLLNLSPGSALTLSRHLTDQLVDRAATIYFALDTDMEIEFDAEAFGEGNTGTRPWMRNTLWVTSVTQDTGNALAHELFHILANSGHHNKESKNLMRDTTSPANTRLTLEQCQQAINTAKKSGLIR